MFKAKFCFVPRSIDCESRWCARSYNYRLILHLKSRSRRGKVTSLETINVYGRSGGITPLFLNLGTRWRQVVSFKARPFNSAKRALGTHSQRRLGGPQLGSAYFVEETNVLLLLLLGIELLYVGQMT
jgi:hypothetical protein